MSKKPSPFTAQPSYLRPPVQQLVADRKINALTTYSQKLLQLLVTNFPNMAQQAEQLQQEFSQIAGEIASLEGELSLRGHGPRGVLFSQGITTEKKNKEFEDSLPVVPEKPLSGQQFLMAIAPYLQFNHPTPQGMRADWVFPDVKTFGAKVVEAKPEDDLLVQEDRLFTLSGGQSPSYTFRLTVGDHVLLFSPRTGPSVLSFSQVEQAWVQHTAFQFVDAERALAAVQEFFSTTSVHDVSPNEYKKLYAKVAALPAAKLEGLAVVTGDNVRDFDLQVNELFTAHLPADAAGSITSVRDDLTWDDLTVFTRRQLWRELVSRVEQAASGPAPAAAKKTAKKAVKKT